MIRSAILAALCCGAVAASQQQLPTSVRLMPDARDLLAVSTASYEDVLVRHLEAMLASASTSSAASDDELAQAKALFKIYKALNPKVVASWGDTEEEQFEVFYATVFKNVQDRVEATAAPTTKNPTTSTTSYTATKTTNATTIADSLSFFLELYNESLAADVRALQDNTQNIEAIIQSTKSTSDSGSAETDPASQYQAPTVLDSVDSGPTSLSGSGSGRRLIDTPATNGTITNGVELLFCDVGGNAIWKWSASDSASSSGSGTSTTTSTTTTTTTYSEENGVCSSTTVETELTVTAYQSGCSLQNHPEGCDNVYWKGCGGLTVNRNANRIVVARTGGRSLGILYYQTSGSSCQGRVVDAVTTYKGKKFNSISDVEYSPAGNLYFTDSPFGLATSADDYDGDTLDTSPLRELPFNGVFLLKENSTKVELLDCDMDRPNKIAFSPEGDVMYVTNSRKGNSYVKSFTLDDDGSVLDSQVFFNFTAHPELLTGSGYADGVKTDDQGNVYVAAYTGVFIFSPKGTLIGNMRSSQEINGIALGGGRMFLTGAFGVVAQPTGVIPSIALPSASTQCDA